MSSGWFDLSQATGLGGITWAMATMWALAGVMLFFAIVRRFQAMLLVPVAFGMLLANLPLRPPPRTATDPASLSRATEPSADPTKAPGTAAVVADSAGQGDLVEFLEHRLRLDLILPVILLGVGLLTDFGPLLAAPRALLLGVAAQMGLFGTFLLAGWFGFDAREAAAIGLLAGADGPAAIFVATRLSPQLIAAVAFSVYALQCLLPVAQPWLLRRLTTEAERRVRMRPLRLVSRVEKLAFALILLIVGCILVPGGAPLIAMLMLGNLLRECGVAEKALKAAYHEIVKVLGVVLGLCVGLTLAADRFLRLATLQVLVLGALALVVATVVGVLAARLLARVDRGNPLNPLIGGAGVSAVPAAACVAQRECQRADPANIILVHASGANIAGLLGTILAAGYFVSSL